MRTRNCSLTELADIIHLFKISKFSDFTYLGTRQISQIVQYLPI